MNVLIYACYYTGTEDESLCQHNGFYLSKERVERMNQPSIEEQLNACREYAVHNGHTVVGEWIADEIIYSKSFAHRLLHNKLVTERKNTNFRAVLFYSWNRVFSSFHDFIMYEHELKRYRLSILRAKPNDVPLF